jgi:GTP-binding protein Era
MRSGMVAVVGRPNVGKSSLVNAMVGQKVSIVTRKPQTTRHRIQGVVHRPGAQIVLVDTPGLHLKSGRALNQYLNDTAAGTLGNDVDLVLFVVEAGKWNEEDEAVLQRLARVQRPVGLVINKVDKVADKTRLLPEIQAQAARREYAFILPVSALKRDNLEALVDQMLARMPEGPALYDEGQVDAQDLSFALGEIIREKLMERLRQELPYVLTVQVEKLEREDKLTRVEAVIVVERENQKAIVIGEKGQALKAVGIAARREMEKRLGQQVFLKLWARAQKGWTDDPEALKRFGYRSQ